MPHIYVRIELTVFIYCLYKAIIRFISSRMEMYSVKYVLIKLRNR